MLIVIRPWRLPGLLVGNIHIPGEWIGLDISKCIHIWYIAIISLSFTNPIIGSFEMKKLRLAIMGKKGKNLDDLTSMDGELISLRK